jgi:hypothetical protein
MRLLSALLGILSAAFATSRLLKDASQDQNRTQCDDKEPQRQNNEHIRMVAAEIAGIRSEIQKEATKPKKTNGEWAYDIVMLVVVAIGSGAAIYTLSKLDETIDFSRRQMAQTEAFTRMSLDQTDMFARQNLDLTKEALTRQRLADLREQKNSEAEQRRFIETNRARMVPQRLFMEIKDNVITVRLPLKNVGVTTARSYRQYAQAILMPPQQTFSMMPREFTASDGSGPVGAGEESQIIKLFASESAERVKQFSEGTLLVYFFGRFEYRDFTETLHTERFCRIVNYKAGLIGSCEGDGDEK